MRWEKEMDGVEAVLKTIWDLQDKISDAIHAISRSHFLNSIKTLTRSETKKRNHHFESMEGDDSDDMGRGGFVFIKDIRAADYDEAAAVAEARSLNAIRTALENLEDQLEFFHLKLSMQRWLLKLNKLQTVHTQQQAERDAALARLEQSRVILAMRLADHGRKKHIVIEEALAFVGDLHDARRFVAALENLFEMPRGQPGETLEDQKGKSSSVLMQMLISSLTPAKNALKGEKIGGVLGNAALFTVSMLAFLQLHQVTFRAPWLQDQNSYTRRIERSSTSQSDSSSQMRHFDVFSARGWAAGVRHFDLFSARGYTAGVRRVPS